MKPKNFLSRGTAIFLIFHLFSFAYGNGINGGKGLTYVKSAWNLESGYVTLYTKSHAFGKTDDNPPVAYWDVQGAISLNFGITDHIELAISPVIYQDTHKGENGYNIPDDLFIGLKFGSYRVRGSSVTWGICLDTRFPTGKDHNLFFEPYSAGKVEWGFTGMLSYSKGPLYPDESLTVDFNLGYLNHNDIGQKLTGRDNDPFPVSSLSQQLKYGVGLKIPTPEFDFSVELFGNSFIQKPPKTAYGLENYLYLTPSIIYKAFNWLSVIAGADFRLSNDIDETSYLYVSSPVPEEFRNYPGWRIHLSFKAALLPIKVYKTSDKDILIIFALSKELLLFKEMEKN